MKDTGDQPAQEVSSDATSPPRRSQAHDVRRCTLVGLGVNILLAVFKFIAGTVGASQAVVADAAHSLSDTTTDIAVLWGSFYWDAPPDKEHPYGHRRIETIVAGLIGLLLVAVAVGLAYNALESLHQSHVSRPRWIAFVAAAASIVTKESLYRWTMEVGRRRKSSSLVANAWHHRSDAVSSVPVAAAVLLAVIRPGWAFVDHIGAALVSVFILRAAWKIVKPAVDELIDRGASAHVRDDIRAMMTRIDGITSSHAIRTRRMGSGLLVDLHITVPGNISVHEGHDISERAKQLLLREGPDVVDVVIHLEPHTSERSRLVEQQP